MSSIIATEITKMPVIFTQQDGMTETAKQLRDLFKVTQMLAVHCDFEKLKDQAPAAREIMARAQSLIRQMDCEDSPTNGVLWNSPLNLPVPNAPLKLRLIDNRVIDGKRPDYVKSYQLGDLGYRDDNEHPVFDMVAWRYP